MRRHLRSFTLIEIVIAVGVLSIIALSVAPMIIEIVKAMSYSRSLEVGLNLARREMAIVNNLAYDDESFEVTEPLTDVSCDVPSGYNYAVTRTTSWAVGGQTSGPKKVVIKVTPAGSAQKLTEIAVYKIDVSAGLGTRAWDDSFYSFDGTGSGSLGDQITGYPFTSDISSPGLWSLKDDFLKLSDNKCQINYDLRPSLPSTSADIDLELTLEFERLSSPNGRIALNGLWGYITKSSKNVTARITFPSVVTSTVSDTAATGILRQVVRDGVNSFYFNETLIASLPFSYAFPNQGPTQLVCNFAFIPIGSTGGQEVYINSFSIRNRRSSSAVRQA